MEDVKVAIIGGENNGDGNIDRFQVDDRYHALLLYDYIQDRYGNDIDSSNVSIRDSANSLAVHLREKGNIVFLNITTYKDNKPTRHGRNGIFIMPDTLTSNQTESLKSFNTEISNFDSIQIWYSFTDKFNCLLSTAHNNDEVQNILNWYIDKNSQKVK